MKRLGFWLLLFFSGILAYTCMIGLGSHGSLWVAVLPILISPASMLIIRIFMERGLPAGLLHPKTQSWAFLFGDSVSIPFTLLFAAFGWRQLGQELGRWSPSTWWLLGSIVIGVVCACLFHFVLDRPNYVKQGHADRLGSPSKLWHDITVYFSLGAAMTYLGLPVLWYLLITNFTMVGLLTLLGFLSWVAFGICDATFHKLDPANLHPRVQDTVLA